MWRRKTFLENDTILAVASYVNPSDKLNKASDGKAVRKLVKQYDCGESVRYLVKKYAYIESWRQNKINKKRVAILFWYFYTILKSNIIMRCINVVYVYNQD